jgi:protease I
MENKGIAAAVAAVVIVVVVAVAGAGAFLLLRGGGGTGPSGDTIATGKKAMLIIAPTNFEDSEYTTTRNVLQQAGVTVSVASSTTATATGSDGLQVTPDLSIANVNVGNYDAVVFIGGTGCETAYYEDSTAHSIAVAADNQGKVVGAICLAPGILANAGILNGKTATIWSDHADTLTNNGATYSAQSVVTDGKIITANGPEAATQFANAIKSALGV